MPPNASNTRTPRARTLLILGTTWCAALPTFADAPRSITELPTLGGSAAIAHGINAHGTVLGESHDGRVTRNVRDERAAWKVFLMPLGGPMTQLEQIAGLYPMLVNDKNAVVGERFGSNAQRYAAFMWTKENGTVSLPAPEGARYGHPVDLDNDGNVLMNVSWGDEAEGTLLLTAQGRFAKLPCLPSHTCRAVAMNAAGRIVGVAADHADGGDVVRRQAIVWSSATSTPTALPGGEGIEPVDLNDRGTILGKRAEDDQESVVTWRDDQRAPTDFGIGSPVALNNHDVAAGTIPGAAAGGPSAVPALWDLAKNARISLPPLNPQDDFLELAGINDAGDVAGTAYDADGNGHVVLYRGYAPAGVTP